MAKRDHKLLRFPDACPHTRPHGAYVLFGEEWAKVVVWVCSLFPFFNLPRLHDSQVSISDESQALVGPVSRLSGLSCSMLSLLQAQEKGQATTSPAAGVIAIAASTFPH